MLCHRWTGAGYKHPFRTCGRHDGSDQRADANRKRDQYTDGRHDWQHVHNHNVDDCLVRLASTATVWTASSSGKTGSKVRRWMFATGKSWMRTLGFAFNVRSAHNRAAPRHGGTRRTSGYFYWVVDVYYRNYPDDVECMVYLI